MDQSDYRKKFPVSLSELSEYVAIRVGFYEKDAANMSRSVMDSQYVPFITVEHYSSKDGQKNKKKILAETLLSPHDSNFGELETYNLK